MVLAHLPKHKQSAGDVKRIGRHHRVTKHYTKTYWPYLPMMFIVLAGLLLNATWTIGQGILGYATDMGPVSLLQETNAQRSQNGLPGLSMNSRLSQAAQAKADDMAARNYWSHTTPDGKEPWQFISDSGYAYVAAGENLAYGFYTSTSAVAGWMNSPSHRANVLNTSYSEVGFGIANAANYQDTGEQTIVVAMYASPKAAAPAPVASTPSTASVAPKQTTPVVQTTPVQPPETQPEPVQPTQPASPATAAPSTETDALDLPSREVARIDVLTQGNAQWLTLAVSTVATISIISFVIRHGRLWKRYLLRGERFVIGHPAFDTLLLTIATVGFVLTRASGFIR